MRYADDANVYVRSHKAGQRVMILLRRLYEKLHLSVNESKSAVASAFGRKFLGYAFWCARDEVRRAVSHKAQKQFKQRIRQLTRRSCGRSLQQIVDLLRTYFCWVGKPISNCRKHQASGVNWINGCGTDSERFNSSNGNGERRLIANCGLWGRVKKSPRKWRVTPAVGGTAVDGR